MQNTTKEQNSVNNVSGVMDLVLCMSSDDVLYLYQGSLKISQRVSELKFIKGHKSIKLVGWLFWA